MTIKNNIDWIYNLKKDVPRFLERIKGKKRKGFYHYSLSGDYIGEYFKWGFGTSFLVLKIIYTLDLENKYQQEIKEIITYLKSFQNKNGSFFNPQMNIITIPFKIKNPKRIPEVMKNLNFKNTHNLKIIRALTRHSISSLLLFKARPKYEYKDFPQEKHDLNHFLSKLNWENPWDAGSHFSHLLFFLNYSGLKNKKDLIQYSINWINKLQHEKDGFWYKGNPTLRLKVNGAMKIITGLQAVDKVDFKYAKKVIDKTLIAKNDYDACDQSNIIYVLKNCYDITRGEYRFNDIENFIYDRIKRYKKYYFPKIGGFSFLKNKSNKIFYGNCISKGKNEPDVHGTYLFLWSLSLIAQILKINDKLKFKEFTF